MNLPRSSGWLIALTMCALLLVVTGCSSDPTPSASVSTQDADVNTDEFSTAFTNFINGLPQSVWDSECGQHVREEGLAHDYSQDPGPGYTFAIDGGVCTITKDSMVFEASTDESSVDTSDPAASMQADAKQDVFDVPSKRDLPPFTGGWGYVESPPFGAMSPGELDTPFYTGDEPASISDLEPRWVACRAGDGGACDDLAVQVFLTSDPLIGKAYTDFGTTCGGRTVDTDEECIDLLGGERTLEGEGRVVRNFSPYVLAVNLQYDLRNIAGPTSAAPGALPESDELWEACGAGKVTACEDLRKLHEFGVNPPEADYRFFAETCGGRTSIPISCPIVLAGPDDRVKPGAAPPGLIEFGGGPFAPDPDASWVACDEGDGRECLSLALEFSGTLITADAEDERWPYRLFGATCGGQLDTRAGPPSCLSYTDWPTVADVDSLPGPRELN